MSIARTEVPRLELYEATGSSRRIQKDFPAGIYSQLAEARAGENNNRSSNKAPPRHNNGEAVGTQQRLRASVALTMDCSIFNAYTLSR